MANLLRSGFESNSTTAGVEWTTAFTAAATISTGTVRSGTYAMKCLANSVNSGNTRFTFAASDQQAGFYARVYLNIAAAPSAATTILSFMNSGATAKVGLNLNTDLTLRLKNIEDNANISSLSAALNTGQWYRIEIFVDTTTLASTTVTGRLDGFEFGTGTADITTGVNQMLLGGITSSLSTGEFYFDDVAINDTSGSFQNSWPGSGKILRLKPSAAGDVNTFATQTGGVAGSGNNFTRVQEVTPDDATTFNGSNTLNQEDLFNVDDSGININDNINVVTVGMRFRNNTADATTALKAEIEKTASGTISQSAAIIPNTTTWNTNATADPKISPLITYRDPDGINWTKSTIDSMQIGYKITAGGTNRVEVSTVYATVDYTPASTASSLSMMGV